MVLSEGEMKRIVQDEYWVKEDKIQITSNVAEGEESIPATQHRIKKERKASVRYNIGDGTRPVRKWT